MSSFMALVFSIFHKRPSCPWATGRYALILRDRFQSGFLSGKQSQLHVASIAVVSDQPAGHRQLNCARSFEPGQVTASAPTTQGEAAG